MTGTIVTRTTKNGSKRYFAVWRDGGKQKWKAFSRRKDAEKFLTASVTATHAGTFVDVTPTPMATVFDRWLTHSLDVRVKQSLMKPSTAKSYKSMLATHLRPAFGEIRSDRLRSAVLADWTHARRTKLPRARSRRSSTTTCSTCSTSSSRGGGIPHRVSGA